MDNSIQPGDLTNISPITTTTESLESVNSITNTSIRLENLFNNIISELDPITTENLSVRTSVGLNSNINSYYTDINSRYDTFTNRWYDSINSISNKYEYKCDFPVFDGYILFPHGVKIELVNKPSEDFLKEIRLLHKAVWIDNNNN